MKNVIEQIRKIKGVVTVEKAGENMAVVVFEPKPKDNGWHVSKIFIDDLKPMTEETAKKLLGVFKPKSLTPEELVDGRIYVDEANGRIVRFNKIKNECAISLYSQKCVEGTYYNSINGFGKSYHYRGGFRPATPSEAQTLIRAEVANGYFHELK